MNTREKHIFLLRTLIGIAEDVTLNRAVTLGTASISELREEIAAARMKPIDFPRVIDIEAMCLLEYLAELSYARSDKNAEREKRMGLFATSLMTFLQIDLANAEKAVPA